MDIGQNRSSFNILTNLIDNSANNYHMKVKYENDVWVLFEQARTIGLVLYGPGFFSGPIVLFQLNELS